MEWEARVERTEDDVKLSSVVLVSGESQKLTCLITYQRAYQRLMAVPLSVCLWVFGSG